MTNFRIILAYNGTAYHGWQRQNNALAVQQVLEEAILSLTGQTVTVTQEYTQEDFVQAFL